MALFSRLGIQSEASRIRVGQAARMVSIAAVRGPYKARCLEQALTVWWMLGLMGIRSTIRLGIYKSGEAVEAHAWVLHEGKIVIGQMNEQKAFTPLLVSALWCRHFYLSYSCNLNWNEYSPAPTQASVPGRISSHRSLTKAR
jgi:hypothetical protein